MARTNPCRLCLLLERRHISIPRADGTIRGSPKVHRERLSFFLECTCEKWHCLTRDKRACGCHFTPLPLSIGAKTPVEGGYPGHCLVCFASNPMALHSDMTALLSQNFIHPRAVRSSPRRPVLVPATPESQNVVF